MVAQLTSPVDAFFRQPSVHRHDEYRGHRTPNSVAASLPRNEIKQCRHVLSIGGGISGGRRKPRRLYVSTHWPSFGRTERRAQERTRASLYDLFVRGLEQLACTSRMMGASNASSGVAGELDPLTRSGRDDQVSAARLNPFRLACGAVRSHDDEPRDRRPK
jgi:hypothetical protein